VKFLRTQFKQMKVQYGKKTLDYAWKSMEEIEERRRWVSRRRGPIAVCFIFIVIFLIPFTPLFLLFPQPVYVTRYTDVTIGSLDEEMFINFEFYNSDSDLVTGEGSMCGHGHRLDPSDTMQEFRFVIELLGNLECVWIKVYFDQPAGTPPSFIQRIGIDQRIYFTLLDIEVSMIIER
jgi:hypothetical protein